MRRCETITYVAFDGTVFGTESECKTYENLFMYKNGVFMRDSFGGRVNDLDDAYVVKIDSEEALARIKEIKGEDKYDSPAEKGLSVWSTTNDEWVSAECIYEWLDNIKGLFTDFDIVNATRHDVGFIREMLDGVEELVSLAEKRGC